MIFILLSSSYRLYYYCWLSHVLQPNIAHSNRVNSHFLGTKLNNLNNFITELGAKLIKIYKTILN